MILNIASFEFRRLMFSPMAWFLLAIIQYVLARGFYNILSAYQLMPDMFQGSGITEVVIGGYFDFAGLLFVLLTPFLTMRLISDELRSGTINLLYSSPVSATQIILGKFLSITLYLLFVIIIITLVPASLAAGTGLDYGQFLSCLIGVLLLAASITAIGLFISSLFRHTVVSAITTFAVLFLLWTIHSAGTSTSENMITVLNYLSMYRHFANFMQGLVSITDLVYFLVICSLFLSLGIWRIDAMRSYHW